MSMRYWKVRLTCYTPICIGSGEKYSKGQYIYSPKTKRVYFLHERKWIFFLWKEKIMDDFSRKLLENPKEFKLYDYLKGQPVLRKKYKDVDALICVLQENGVIDREERYLSQSAKEKEPNNDIVCFSCDAEGVPYIPGSSIKGAMRTAILSDFIRKHKDDYANEWKEIESIAQEIQKIPIPDKRDKRAIRLCKARFKGSSDRLKSVVDHLEKRLSIAVDKKGERDMVNSYFRGLSISDAVLKEGERCIIPKLDLAVNSNKLHPIKALFREALQAGSILEFTVGIDDDSENGMGHFGIKTFSDLKVVLQNYLQFQHDLLKEPFKNNAKEEIDDLRDAKNVNLRLGAGTGFLMKTLLYSLAPDPYRAVMVTREWMQREFPEGKHFKDDKISPHTLNLVYKDGYTYLMGLATIKEEPLC